MGAKTINGCACQKCRRGLPARVRRMVEGMTPEAALRLARRMLREGAAILEAVECALARSGRSHGPPGDQRN